MAPGPACHRSTIRATAPARTVGLLQVPIKRADLFEAPFTMRSVITRRCCHLAVVGELDDNSRTAFTILSCRRLEQPDVDRLTIDMSRLTFIGAGGVNALVAIRNSATLTAKELVLLNPSRPTLRVLDLTSLINTFTIASNRGAASIGLQQHREPRGAPDRSCDS